MFAAGKTAAVSGAGPDAQFNYVTMLLHGDGTNGAQNNTFLDSSTNNFSITRNGNTTQGSFSPYGSNWGVYFGSTDGNSLTTPTITLAGDCTLETWIYPTSGSTSGYSIIFNNGGSLQALYYYTDGSIGVYFPGGGSGTSSAGTLAMNVWSHVAMVRSGSTVKVYVNGVDVGLSITQASSFNISRISGYSGGTTYNVYGYLSNVRIGTTAVYTANFTPPTTPLTAISGTQLLTCQSNRFIDNSSNAYTLTLVNTPIVQRFNPFGTSTAYSTATIGGSGYFDGTGDYLTIADSTAFTLGTSNYTMEMWTYPTSFAAQVVPFAYQWSSSGGNRLIVIIQNTDGTMTVYYNGAVDVYSTSNTVKLNAWNHLALVRNGNTFVFYINGVSSATNTVSVTYPDSTYPVIVGASWDGSTGTVPFPGYISDARVVVGTAVYTSAFTPPTAPLTAVTNTKLLTNMTNGAIYDNAMMNDLETVGNTQISTSVKKYGTGSMAFDGTGDYLTAPVSPNYNFGTSDFTVECWVYRNTSTTGYETLIGFDVTGGLLFQIYTNELDFGVRGTASNLSGVTVPSGQWVHLALARQSGVVRYFQDGVLTRTYSGTYATNNFTNSAPLLISGYSASGGQLNGYIDDLRITKGYARYTTTFTPPTSALADKSTS